MTGYECAKEAGYSEDRARVTASELQSPRVYPLVVKYIGEIREEYQKKYAVTFERHITELGKIRQEALRKGAWSAAVNAEVARGKAAGLYIEQKIIRTGKLDDLSEDELEKRMTEIMNEYSPILEGKSSEELKEKVKDKQPSLIGLANFILVNSLSSAQPESLNASTHSIRYFKNGISFG